MTAFHARVNRSFQSGTQLIRIASSIAEAMGLQLAESARTISALKAPLARGTTFSGLACDVMHEFVEPLGLRWAVRDGAVAIWGAGALGEDSPVSPPTSLAVALDVAAAAFKTCDVCGLESCPRLDGRENDCTDPCGHDFDDGQCSRCFCADRGQLDRFGSSSATPAPISFTEAERELRARLQSIVRANFGTQHEGCEQVITDIIGIVRAAPTPEVASLKCSRCGGAVFRSWDHVVSGEGGERWTCDARTP